MMKKLLFVIVTCTLLVAPVLIFQPAASAVDIISGPCTDKNAASQPEICKDNNAGASKNPIYGPDGILTVAINILSLIVGIAAVVIIVVEGLRMILAGSDTNTAATARRGVIYASVGLGIALVSQAVIALV